MKYSDDIKKWADEMWSKLDKKLSKAAVSAREILPYEVIDGRYAEKGNTAWWTNGFWGGLMWLMYVGTRNEEYKLTAQRSEELLDEALDRYEGLHHDVGFMWRLTAGANYQITGDKKARERQYKAATFLAARYNVDGGYIRAWNGDNTERFKQIAIIDCMMNIPLLYWMSRETGDDRYKSIAMRHADKTMKYHVRADGSVNHIMRYDNKTGEVICAEGGQGASADSSWSRGQAWGLYGFTLSYIHTQKKEYLETAKKIANYFIAAVCNDWLPKSDFRANQNPVLYDSTAGAIAAAGLIELAGVLPEDEGEMYLNSAVNILKAMESSFADWSDETDGILDFGSEQFIGGTHKKIIYGDYYFAESIYKLKGFEPLFW